MLQFTKELIFKILFDRFKLNFHQNYDPTTFTLDNNCNPTWISLKSIKVFAHYCSNSCKTILVLVLKFLNPQDNDHFNQTTLH